MDPDAHETGSLLNIWSGQVAQPNVNVDRALDIGAEQMTCLRDHGQIVVTVAVKGNGHIQYKEETYHCWGTCCH